MEENNKFWKWEYIKIILICTVIIIVAIFTYHSIVYITTSGTVKSDEVKNKLNEICIDKGYKEATDYTWERFNIRDNKGRIRLECDKVILTGYYNYDIKQIETCSKRDKWGECCWYNVTYEYKIN